LPDIDIYHFNDFHRRLDSFADGTGGVARLSTLLKRVQAEKPDALVVNGGDVAGDQSAHGPDAFNPIPDLFNEMGADVVGLGNHEFEDPSGKYGTLRSGLIERLDGDVLCANVSDSQGQPLAGTCPYVLRRIQGVNVALIGVVTRNLTSALFPAAGVGLRVAPLEATLRELVPQVRSEGADVVVVMAHEGLNETRALARAVSGVDLFLAAHDHRSTQEPVVETSPAGQPVPVAEAGGYGRALGHVRISVGADHRVTGIEGELLPVSADIPPDPAVQAIVDRYVPAGRAERPAPRKWRTVSLEELGQALREQEEPSS